MRVAEEATDFSSWSSDRLRAFLEARGAEHELVTEHADLVSLAHETEAATGAAREASEQGEEDPLDAFMAGMAAEAGPSRPARRAVTYEEDYDPVASYLEARTRTEAVVPPPTDCYDSDEEVYRTAAQLEAASGPTDEERAEALRGDGAPLEEVDHAAQEYDDFERDFYRPAPEIARLTEAEVAERRAASGVRAGGHDPPAPVERFGQCGLPAAALLLLKQRGYSAPTAVQASALPAALSGRDLLACAQTGSGKTVAFLLPALVHAAAQTAPGPGEGPLVLILAPTRELGQQIHGEAVRLGAAWGLCAAALLGGHDKRAQVLALRAGAALAVATPGRAINLARGARGALQLRRVSLVVLDEADRLLSLGFEPAVRSLVRAVRPDAQTLLFSATLGGRVCALADDLLEQPVRLSVGGGAQGGGGNADVTQRAVVLPDHAARLPWLLAHAPSWVDAGQVLLFCARIATCDSLAADLRAAGVRAAAMHGDMDQAERSVQLSAFRSGRVHALVATDLAARGLDVPSLRTVVCFDPARDADTHTHRVGRTGRAGATDGVAYSLLTPGDGQAARMVAQHMEATFQPVSQQLAALAQTCVRLRKRGRGAGGGGLGFDSAGRAGMAVLGRFMKAFVPSSDGVLAQQQAPEIIAPKSGWKPQPPPPPPPLPPHLQQAAAPPPPPARGVDPGAAARAAALAIATRLAASAPPDPLQQAHALPPPPPLQRRSTAGESYNAMPPPASLNASLPPRPMPSPGLTPQQAAARAAAEAVAARLFGTAPQH